MDDGRFKGRAGMATVFGKRESKIVQLYVMFLFYDDGSSVR